MASLVESTSDDNDSVSVKKHYQRLFIIRHGERLDCVDFSWERKAERPYDPPLTSQGVEDASSAARERLVGKVRCRWQLHGRGVVNVRRFGLVPRRSKDVV